MLLIPVSKMDKTWGGPGRSTRLAVIYILATSVCRKRMKRHWSDNFATVLKEFKCDSQPTVIKLQIHCCEAS